MNSRTVARSIAFDIASLLIVSSLSGLWLAAWGDNMDNPLPYKVPTSWVFLFDKLMGLDNAKIENVIEFTLVLALVLLMVIMYRLTVSKVQHSANVAHGTIDSDAFKASQANVHAFMEASQDRFKVLEQHLAMCNSDRKQMIALLETIHSEGPSAVRVELARTLEVEKDAEKRMTLLLTEIRNNVVALETHLSILQEQLLHWQKKDVPNGTTTGS